MKKHFKLTSLLLVVALLISCLCIPVSAASPESSYTFGGADMSWVLCDEDGNIVQQSNPVSRVTYDTDVDIPNGYTLFFYANSNRDFFSLYKDTTIEFMVKWSSAAVFLMGYDKVSVGNGTVQVYAATNSERTHTESITIPDTTRYVFWVTNMSTDTKTLTKATIENT